MLIGPIWGCFELILEFLSFSWSVVDCPIHFQPARFLLKLPSLKMFTPLVLSGDGIIEIYRSSNAEYKLKKMAKNNVYQCKLKMLQNLKRAKKKLRTVCFFTFVCLDLFVCLFVVWATSVVRFAFGCIDPVVQWHCETGTQYMVMIIPGNVRSSCQKI